MKPTLAEEFAALEALLAHAEGGELAWPDAEQDVDAFRDCARAAKRLGWLGNDGAAEPTRVGDLDSFLLGLGGWLSADEADPAAFTLANQIVRAEVEHREGSFEALAIVLDHVESGRLVWPVEAGDRARLFEAMACLGWLPGVVPSAPDDTPDPDRKDLPMTTTTDTPKPTWKDLRRRFRTWGDLKRSGLTWGDLKNTERKD